MTSLDDMVLFCAVAKHESFTAAAQELKISKQAASGRIARLERALGARLFARSTRHVSLTEQGRLYRARCLQILSMVTLAEDELAEAQHEPVGLLRISAPVEYGRRFIVELAAKFLAQYPRVRLEVCLTNRKIDLLREGFDLALRIGELVDDGLIARKVGLGQLRVVASAQYLARYGAPRLDAPELWRCIGVLPQERWWVEGRMIELEPVLLVNDLGVARDAALAGVGVVQLPSFMIQRELQDGVLTSLFEPSDRDDRAIYVVYPERELMPLKVRCFLETISAQVNEHFAL